MSARFDVVGVGCCAADTLCVYEQEIRPDTKMPVRGMARQGGGLVATGLVAVARLGARARYLGKVGDDGTSRFIRSEFEREGVDVSGLLTEPGASAIASFIVASPATHTRTIFYCLDGIARLKPEDLRKEDVLSGDILFVDGFFVEPAIQAARWAREAGRRIVMDAELTEPENDELMDLSTHIIASQSFAASRVGDIGPEAAAKALFDRIGDSSKVVGVTCGGGGSYFVTAEECFHQPAFQVEVVDTTGCGDVFHGAFAFGLAQGWPLRGIAEFASAVAAMKARRLGGRAGIPSRGEAEAFLADHPGGA